MVIVLNVAIIKKISLNGCHTMLLLPLFATTFSYVAAGPTFSYIACPTLSLVGGLARLLPFVLCYEKPVKTLLMATTVHRYWDDGDPVKRGEGWPSMSEEEEWKKNSDVRIPCFA